MPTGIGDTILPVGRVIVGEVTVAQVFTEGINGTIGFGNVSLTE